MTGDAKTGAGSLDGRRGGPLAALRIVIVGGIGPGPFAAMLLADLGADVVRIERPGETSRAIGSFARSQRSVALDLKSAADLATLLALIDRADALIEGFRPGVMERLGLGPDVLLARNPKLAYGRMTGWGQDGPLAQAAGHDIDYIALTGALHAIGPAERPVVPLNLVGDFGGGALYLAMGLLSAIVHVRNGGAGQVVDCAMVDGAASLMTMFHALRDDGLWRDERAANLLDGGAPCYDTYRCADGRFIAVGALEPAFYARLRAGLGLADDPAFDDPHDRRAWPAQKAKIAAIVATRSRDEWCAAFDGSDACVAPVLDLGEAPRHPHHVARSTYVEVGGRCQPGPAPRFSATPNATPRPPSAIGADREATLRDWGVSA